MRYFILFVLFISVEYLNAQDISSIAKSLNLYPGTKASIQWERVFANERKLKKYSINTLKKSQQEELRAYLIKYAADSDQPIVPGL